MIIYHHRQCKGKLKRFIFRRNNDWMAFLIGINLEEDTQGVIQIYPVYRAIHFIKEPNCLLIEIPLFNKGLVIIFEKFNIRFALLDADFPEISDVGNIDQHNLLSRKENR